MTTPTERKYEFFVTTDEPHQPAGVERSMIRRLVMRNYFDTKMAGPQLDVPEHTSISAVEAERQLKSRFRLSDISIERKKALERQKEDRCKKKKEKGKRPQASRAGSGPTPLSSTAVAGNSRKCHLSKKKNSISKRNTSEPVVEKPTLEADPSSHRMDPFDALPIPGTPQLDALFRLYKRSSANNSVAPDPTHTWRPFILHDAGLLHATLASWALYGMLANESHNLRLCELEHKNQAINILAHRLPMCWGKNLIGAYDAAQLHLTALRSMVEGRGGIFAFGKNDGLMRGILWIDFHTAAAFRTTPSFPHVWLSPDTPLPDELKNEATYASPTTLLQLSCAAIDCFNVFYRLHRLALAVSSHWTGRVARVALSNLTYETQFIILSVPDRSWDFLDFDQGIQDEASGDHEHQKQRADAASVVEALLAAALIFVYAVLRALPLKTKIFTILLRRLRTAIERPNTSVLETWSREKNLHMLLWALATACLVVTGRERMWWATQLSCVCQELGIGSRQHLEHELQRVAWTDLFFDARIDGIWAEVMRLRTLQARASAATADPALLATRTWG
ncbi:hypothetical protein G6011_00227 [Alternaria panax]|uniref:Uncharacterized protein n=1 Tax=Alternaria panax TaxID=48097 RepID=A0AAD4IIB2_9PLEO|nr:hypothetical protein G6011_00227 [Alternaria panax]